MMRFIVLLSISMLMLFAVGCGEKGGDSAAPANLEGFEMVDIPGPLTKALRTGDVGNPLEEGYLIDGKRNGIWITYHSDGRVNTIQHYADDKLHGMSLVIDGRGQITEKAHYEQNTYDGLKATYRFGRAQEEIPYKNGVIDGRVARYYNNGKLMEEIEYSQGVQDGIYRHYNDQGEMDLDYVYKDGDKVSGGIVSDPEEE